MDQGNSTLNASSLIDLKAELHKKYESFRNIQIKKNTTQVPKPSHFKIKGEIRKDKKFKQTAVKSKVIDYEEDLTLKKSREALEAKAKLYENIVSNKVLIDDEQKDCFLVDFQRKVLYEPQETSISKASKEVKKDITVSDILQNNSESLTFTNIQKNVVEKNLENPDQPIHYQNIQYNEIRDHGTGYFAFSTDENKRREQMEELSSLRQETEEQRLKRQMLEKKRKAKLQARLSKICERKNIDRSLLESCIKDEEVNEMGTTQNKIDLTSIPLPTNQLNLNKEQQNEKKPCKVRPWDIGKNNLQSFIPEKRIKSQNEWVEEKREERPIEFAPPASYTNYS